MNRANALVGVAIAVLVSAGCRGSTNDDKGAPGTTGHAPGHAPGPGADESTPPELRFKPATEADLGVPIYPGSTASGSEADPLKKIGKTHTITMSDRVTDDPVDKVVSFYKAKAPALEQSKLDDGIALTGTPVAGGGEIVMSVKPSGGHTAISIMNTN